MTWIAGRFNNADLGTKVLQKARFLELVEKAGPRDRAREDAIVHHVRKVQPGVSRLLKPLWSWPA